MTLEGRRVPIANNRNILLNLPLFLLSPGNPWEVDGSVLACHSVDHQSSLLPLSTGCRCRRGPAWDVADGGCRDCGSRRGDEEQFWVAFVGPVTEDVHVESLGHRKEVFQLTLAHHPQRQQQRRGRPREGGGERKPSCWARGSQATDNCKKRLAGASSTRV